MSQPADNERAEAPPKAFRCLVEVERAEADGETVEEHLRRRVECQHALIVAARAYPKALMATGLRSTDFDAPDYGLLWMAIENVMRTNPQADSVSDGEFLEHARKLGARFRTPDGHNILLRLCRDPAVGVEYALTVLAKELRATDDLRVWAETAKNFAERVQRTADPLALRHEWVVEAQAIAQRYDNGTSVKSLDESAQAWRSKGSAGSIVPTGFSEIDRPTGGGLGRGDMMVIGGGTNHGKSYFATKMLKNQADLGKTCLYISVEDSEELLLCRMLADYADPPLAPKDIRVAMHGSSPVADPKIIDAAAVKMRAHQQGRVKTVHAPKWTVSQVCNSIRQHRYLHGIDMVVVDYIQAVQPDQTSNNKTQDVAFIVSELKKCAHEVGVALVVLSQYARDEYRNGTEPTVNSCKYAGDIENEAEVMLLLWRDEDHQLWAKLAKLKWASSVGHRYIVATHEVTGAVLDWTRKIEDPASQQDQQQQQQQRGRGGQRPFRRPSGGNP